MEQWNSTTYNRTDGKTSFTSFDHSLSVETVMQGQLGIWTWIVKAYQCRMCMIELVTEQPLWTALRRLTCCCDSEEGKGYLRVYFWHGLFSGRLLYIVGKENLDMIEGFKLTTILHINLLNAKC